MTPSPDLRQRIALAFNSYGLPYLAQTELIDKVLACFPSPPSTTDMGFTCPHGCYVTGTATKICYHPQPSREACHKILKDADFCDQEGVIRCVDALLAWATGQPKEPEWCEHWTRGKENNWKETNGPGWITGDSDYQFCPYCAAPCPASP